MYRRILCAHLTTLDGRMKISAEAKDGGCLVTDHIPEEEILLLSCKYLVPAPELFLNGRKHYVNKGMMLSELIVDAYTAAFSLVKSEALSPMEIKAAIEHTEWRGGRK